MNLSPERLRATRKERGLTLKQVAGAMGVSIPQVQRLENGERRMTFDTVEAYCAAIGVKLIDFLRDPVMVPIIGIIDEMSAVLPLTPNTPYEVRAPYLFPEPERLAAVRYEPRGRILSMTGHLGFFFADVEGVPDDAWGQRCIVKRADGTERLGWPIREGGQAHIDDVVGSPEFNVDLVWASPILAMATPYLLNNF